MYQVLYRKNLRGNDFGAWHVYSSRTYLHEAMDDKDTLALEPDNEYKVINCADWAEYIWANPEYAH